MSTPPNCTQQATLDLAAAGRPIARGIALRHLLVVLLVDAGGPLSVADLCQLLDERTIAVPGRPSKAVSDALRWEVHRGRVHRVERAVYRAGRLDRKTVWRMRQRVRQLRS